MAVVWERSGEAFYADVEAADGTRYDLIVERLRNVSTTLIHPGSTFKLDSVTPAGGLWLMANWPAPRSLRSGRKTAVGGFRSVGFRSDYE
jgi:hypothetical protein